MLNIVSEVKKNAKFHLVLQSVKHTHVVSKHINTKRMIILCESKFFFLIRTAVRYILVQKVSDKVNLQYRASRRRGNENPSDDSNVSSRRPRRKNEQEITFSQLGLPQNKHTHTEEKRPLKTTSIRTSEECFSDPLWRRDGGRAASARLSAGFGSNEKHLFYKLWQKKVFFAPTSFLKGGGGCQITPSSTFH